LIRADAVAVKERVASKSMLASKNIKPSVRSPEQGHHWLSVLAGELHVRLRDAREISPGLWPKTLVLSHRTGRLPARFDSYFADDSRDRAESISTNALPLHTASFDGVHRQVRPKAVG